MYRFQFSLNPQIHASKYSLLSNFLHVESSKYCSENREINDAGNLFTSYIVVEMLFSIAGRIIAGLLVALVGLVVFYYVTDEHTSQTSVIYMVTFIALGLLGAATSASIGRLATTMSAKVKSLIWAAGIVFLILSFASVFTGGTSISAMLILTSLIMVAMIARISLNRGDVSWKLAGRVIAAVIVLVTVGVVGLYANNCGSKCLNPGFAVLFVGLGVFGAGLCVWAGQLLATHSANIKLTFNTAVALYVVLSIGSVVSGLSYMSAGWVIVALTLIGAAPQTDDEELVVDSLEAVVTGPA